MNSVSSSKIFIFSAIILLMCNLFISVGLVRSSPSSSTSSFNITQFQDRIITESPVYDNNSNLYMRLTTGVLTPSSNPYINISYVNASSNREEFSSAYIFHSLIEYTQNNSSIQGPDSNQIDQVQNIGINNTLSPFLSVKGYKPITVSSGTFQNEVNHIVTISTKNGLFTLTINIPENTVYPNNVQVNVPGLFLTAIIQNFPFQFQNSSLALNIKVVTSTRNNIDFTSSNNFDVYENYSSELKSSFYCQNASISDVQSELLSLNSRILSTDLVLNSTTRSFLSFTGFIGQIDPSTFPPGFSDTLTGGIGHIMDYSVNFGFTNIQFNTSDVVFVGFFLASILSFLALLYYFLKNYLIYIVGIIMAISVSLYLPTRKVTAIQALHHDKRKEIMDILHEAAGSGIVMQELKEKIELPQTTLLWHLQILEEFEFITRVKIHKQIVIISNDFLEQFDPRVKEIELSFLSDQGEKFRQFISLRGLNEPFSVNQVVGHTAWHIKTVKRHIKHMMNLGIIIALNKPNTYVIAPEFYKFFMKN